MFLSCLHWVNESETKEVFDEEYFIGTLRGEHTSIPICLPAGTLYIIDILRGDNQEKKIIKNEHDKLRTWGKRQESIAKPNGVILPCNSFKTIFMNEMGEDGSLHLTDKGSESQYNKNYTS